MKILIVDDSPSDLKLLRAVLESEDFEVAEASDGTEALAALAAGGVELMITDILMPRMDGYRLCQEVRKSAHGSALPIIFHTATYTEPGDEKLCYDLGGDKYLRKPATKRELLATIREATRAARPARTTMVSEADVMKEYSERLVCKLEDKLQELEKARGELQEANRELESRVRQRTAELESANRELESFSYSVSHDLSAPLNHVRGYIDVVLRNSAGQLDETNTQYLQKAQRASTKMSELIGALLDLSRLTCAELKHRPVDLSALAGELAGELRQMEPGRKVQVEITPAMTAVCDRRLMRVALSNLLNNAWKYTRKQAGARIEFGRMVGSDGVTTYYVRDNGAGFDMIYVDKLFEPFQRLHAATEFEGMGIGLTTVRRIVARHNGRIWAEGAVGRGATFFFTLEAGISG